MSPITESSGEQRPSVEVKILAYDTPEEYVGVEIHDVPENRLVMIIAELFSTLSPEAKAACVGILSKEK